MPGGAEEGPFAVPGAKTPERLEARVDRAPSGGVAMDTQAPAAHVMVGMEHGPGSHGGPPLLRSARAAVATGAAFVAPAWVARDPSETEHAVERPSANVAAACNGIAVNRRLRAARALSVRCREEWRMRWTRGTM